MFRQPSGFSLSPSPYLDHYLRKTGEPLYYTKRSTTAVEQWLYVYGKRNTRSLTFTVSSRDFFFFFPMFSRDLQKLTLRSGDCELNWGRGGEKVEGTGHEYVLPCGPLKYCQDEEPCAASNKRLLLDPFPLLIWNSCQSPAVCRPQSLI